ncbi:MAG: YceI family protein [Alphaproteobacteria bacterium]|nr:YceI family protein [Alphaproteobacteria bacterium]MDE1987065.1 YceI family protein [Alphaproteobacteria bacterium]MDE2163898.1 YceI family protein [Alphaproteobacteria bacterium]MDE2266580.1 YceI family protein [Alphaproteobacteria bacterium]
MKAVAVAAALFTCAATPACAAHWVVDAAKSELGFRVAWSNEPFVAVFHSWKADIDFDPADLSHAHVSVTVDLASEASDSPDNDDGLKGAYGFAVSQFPTARFETTDFKRQRDGSYVADAKLTIRGMTRSIRLPFKLTFSGNSVHMTGTTLLDRTSFGVGQGEWAAPAPVAHAVTVTVDLTATKS